MCTKELSCTAFFFKHLENVVFLFSITCILIKRPARDACLYLWERGERVGPLALPAPAFSIAYIAQQLLGGFSSNLAHVCSSSGKSF